MKIYAPNTYANGVYASVQFTNGVGETDNPHLIEWFKKHGYRLEKCDDKLIIPSTSNQIESKNDELNDTSEPNFEAMTPNELREWLREHGYGSKIKNTRNKEKLLEILRG